MQETRDPPAEPGNTEAKAESVEAANAAPVLSEGGVGEDFYPFFAVPREACGGVFAAEWVEIIATPFDPIATPFDL